MSERRGMSDIEADLAAEREVRPGRVLVELEPEEAEGILQGIVYERVKGAIRAALADLEATEGADDDG